MFWQRILHSDLVCNFWVENSANRVAEGPSIEVEYSREFVLDAKVVYDKVRMAFGREGLHELANCGEVAKPEAEGRLWLGCVSRSLLTPTDSCLIDIPVHRERVDDCGA